MNVEEKAPCKPFDLWTKRMGENKGRPRLWIETKRIEKSGLSAGCRFNVEQVEGGLRLVMDDFGAHTVSSKNKNGNITPVIDLNSSTALSELAKFQVVRVIISERCVWVLPLASDLAKAERIERVLGKLKSNQPLVTGSLAHGGGIASHATHAGLKDVLGFANEIEEDYVSHATHKNEVTASASCLLVAPLQELVQDRWVMNRLPKVEILEMGIPCSGASKAGKSKNKNVMMESHVHVGHLIYGALCIISQVQPAIVCLENVEGYADSASAEILRHQLRDMGYNVSEVVLNSQDYGCLEARVRWFLVGATSGLDLDVTFAAKPSVQQSKVLGDLLEPVALDAPCWSELSYLKSKETRDKEAGKGFAMQIVDEASMKVPVIRKNYNKGGSTDPFVLHPENPNLLRKFTPVEHARIKGIPEHLVEGLPATTAHEILGQSIVYDVVRSLFRDHVGKALKALALNGPSANQQSAALLQLQAVTG
jgi:DNA (cytosine-5)-methyltransferase 1